MASLREEVQDLYDDYVEALDDDALERWPGLFTEDCVYQVIPRDNFDQGLPLATTLCESRGMLEDRVMALRSTSMFAPRYVRHLVSNVRARESNGAIEARANYLVLETPLAEGETRILSAGRYQDVIVRDEDRLRFREKRCIFDSILVPNSLVYPL